MHDHEWYNFWFLVGTYVPLERSTNFAQLLMKCTPATYIAALCQQVLMNETLKWDPHKGSDVMSYPSSRENGCSTQVARVV